MRRLLAVAVLVAGLGCSDGSPTNSTSLEPRPVTSSIPAPAASPTPAVEPTPESGPTYWSARYEDPAVLVHENAAGHTQQATSCGYAEGSLVASATAMVPPHSTARVPLPASVWEQLWKRYYPGPWEPLHEPIPAVPVQLFGIVGEGRTCAATAGAIGNVTTRWTYTWNPESPRDVRFHTLEICNAQVENPALPYRVAPRVRWLDPAGKVFWQDRHEIAPGSQATYHPKCCPFGRVRIEIVDGPGEWRDYGVGPQACWAMPFRKTTR